MRGNAPGQYRRRFYRACLLSLSILLVNGCSSITQQTSQPSQKNKVDDWNQQLIRSFQKLPMPDYSGTAIKGSDPELISFYHQHTLQLNKIIRTLASIRSQQEQNSQPNNFIFEPAQGNILRPLNKKQLNHVQLTLGQQGFSIGLTDKMVKRSFYQQLLALRDQHIMVIGAGWGDLSLKLLANKNNLLVIEPQVGEILGFYDQARLLTAPTDQPEQLFKSPLNRLYLSTHYYPEGFSKLPRNTFDSIVMERLLPVMSPNEIEQGLKLAYQLLKKDGRLFILTVSDQQALYQRNIKPYPDRILSHNHGLIVVKSEQALPSQAFALPPTVTFVKTKPFTQYLNSIGFHVEHISFPDSTQKTDSKTGKAAHNDRRNIAIIAIKK